MPSSPQRFAFAIAPSGFTSLAQAKDTVLDKDSSSALNLNASDTLR